MRADEGHAKRLTRLDVLRGMAAPHQSWQEYILLENVPERREADSVALVTSVGYAKIGQQDHNVLLKKNAITDD